jgi:hypothetical protein
MNPAKVVVHAVKRHVSDVILNLLRERICGARKSAHRHPHGKVLALDVAGAYVRRIGISYNGLGFAADALSRS